MFWWLKNVSIRMNLIRLALTFGRAPDKFISKPDTPGIYLCRWHIIPHNRWFNVYLHWFNQSDEDRALHDHPRWNMSWILEGEYYEVTPGPGFFTSKKDAYGNVTYPVINDTESLKYEIKKSGFKNRTIRQATQAHRILLLDEKPVWTLFFVGKWVREWGFFCPKGWVDNDTFEKNNGCG
jgi:hypothetical protein